MEIASNCGVGACLWLRHHVPSKAEQAGWESARRHLLLPCRGLLHRESERVGSVPLIALGRETGARECCGGRQCMGAQKRYGGHLCVTNGGGEAAVGSLWLWEL